jgi:hypothetical protein
MKSEFKETTKIIIVIAISLFIPISSAYVCYYTVAAADFLCPDLNYESFDQEFLFAAYENELKVFVPNGILTAFPLTTYLYGQLFDFSFHISSHGHGVLILRC